MNELPTLKKSTVKPSRKKPKILLLSDDLRLPSGIGTISKEIVLNTVEKFDWVQLGAAVNHPDKGKGFDLSHEIQKETGVQDASVKLMAWSGYGDRNVLFSMLNQEKPDAIFHFTDPRYWTWLYALEHEIKGTYNIPIVYYSIWDDLPFPMWNAPYYASCDLIMGISKQSHNIHNEVLRQNGFLVFDKDIMPESEFTEDKIITSFVPHGLDSNIYKPLDKEDPIYKSMYTNIKEHNNIDFLIFWNNRNIRRKQPGDVILSFKEFVDNLPDDKKDSVGLLMHTEVVDNNGTDLRSIYQTLAPGYKIIFSEKKLPTNELNAMYNVADVVVNIASNEGWGLSSTEALLSATMIINNVTGGLQDQCKFVDENGDWIIFDSDFTTNHNATYTECGEWALPVFPSNRSLQGSPATPYIFDDRVDFRDVAKQMRECFNLGAEERERRGQKGRDFALESGLTSKQMGDKMIEMIEFLLEKKKRLNKRYTLSEVTRKQYEKTGIV